MKYIIIYLCVGLLSLEILAIEDNSNNTNDNDAWGIVIDPTPKTIPQSTEPCICQTATCDECPKPQPLPSLLRPATKALIPLRPLAGQKE